MAQEQKTKTQTVTDGRAQRIEQASQKKSSTQIQTQQRALQVERSGHARTRSNTK